MEYSSIVLDTLLLSSVRVSLFYLCRRFLLHTLYADLRHLSTTPSTPHHPLAPTHSIPPSDSSAAQSPAITESRLSSSSELDLLPLPVSALHPPPQTLSTPHFPPPPSTSHSLLPHLPTRTSLSRTIFALTFSESCLLFLLVILQSLDLLTPRSRLWNWHFSLLVSSILILLLSPLLQAYLLLFQHDKRSLPLPLRIASLLLPYTLYILLLLRIPLPPQLTSAGHIQSWLARLILLGVLMLGTLSGLGALTASSTLFAALSGSHWTELKQDDITTLEHSLLRIKSDLLERKRELDRRQPNNDDARTPWMSRLLGRGAGAREESSLRREIAGLEMLDDQMARQLESMKAHKARVEFSKTIRGRAWNIASWMFGVYCTFRIISVILNVFLPSQMARLHSSPSAGPSETEPSRAPDLITYYLAYLVTHLPGVDDSALDVEALGRQISLVMVGAIVGSNVRLVLRSVARALKVTSRNTGASFMLLILSQIMGMYLLSTLVQLRSSLPQSEPLFAELPNFQVFGSLFDWSFLGMAGAAAVWRWVRRRVVGSGVEDWVHLRDG